MNRKLGFGLAVVAAVASMTVFAQENEVAEAEETGSIGWTPIAIGIASPVQIPWGSARWDVFGLDLGLLWADAPKMYGLGFGGVAMATRDDLMGLQVSSLCNWATKDVYGARLTLGANISFGESYGCEMGMFGYREGKFWGWDSNFIGAYGTEMYGVQLAGIVNLNMVKSYGATVAIGGNMTPLAYGLQMSGVFNFTDELHGCQLGLVNFARECPWGFQIGLVNIIMDNAVKVLPIINGYF